MDNMIYILLWIFVSTNFLSYIKAYENDDDSVWLESIMAAPRARLNQKHQYTYSKDIDKRQELLDGFLIQNDELNLLLRRYANAQIQRNRFLSHGKRNSWFTEDPGNRATDTTPTVLPSTSTTMPTTQSTTAPSRSNSGQSVPNKPSWWPPTWSWPWGKRRRRRLVSNRI